MSYERAPFCEELERCYTPDDRPVSGPLAPYVGRRYDQVELWTAHYEHGNLVDHLERFERERPDLVQLALDRTRLAPELVPPWMSCIRAFEVPSLVGEEFGVLDETQLAESISVWLTAKCPGIDWVLDDVNVAALRKYLIVHTSVPAPPDATTGHPMALEIFGKACPTSSPNGDYLKWRERHPPKRAVLDGWSSPITVHAAIAEPFTVRVTVASYANVQSPSVGVGFYL